jgi:Flp pilus assembly pilin Flp
MFFKIKKEKGAAAVEFALVLPIIIMIVFGIVYFGPVYNNWIAITHAARDGARLLAIKAKFDADGNIDSDGEFSEERLKKNIENNLPEYVKNGSNWGALENINIEINNPHSNIIGDEVSVEVNGEFILNIPLVFENKTITISKEITMRQEQ